MSIAIHTERLILRQLSDNDWNLFQRLHSNPDVISLCFDEPSVVEIKDRFESRLSPWSIGSEHWLCLTIIEIETGKKVGVTGLRLSDGVAEVGYLFLPMFHGKGYATESLQAVLRWSTSFGVISRYKAVVTEGNVASEKVLEKCGFCLSEVVKDAYVIRGSVFDDHIFTKCITAQ